jgi:hypothetical protein
MNYLLIKNEKTKEKKVQLSLFESNQIEWNFKI